MKTNSSPFKNPQAEQKYQAAITVKNLTKTKKALEFINEAVTLEEHPDIYLLRGQILDYLGQSEKAILDYGKAIELAPDRYEGYLERGRLLSRDDQYQAALDDLNKAIKINPASETFAERGQLYYAQGDQYEAAIKDFTRAIELNDFENDDSSLADTYESRADCYEQLGKDDLASADREKLEEIIESYDEEDDY